MRSDRCPCRRSRRCCLLVGGMGGENELYWSSHAKMMMDGERFRHFETTAPAHVDVPTQVILISQSILAWGIVPNLC